MSTNTLYVTNYPPETTEDQLGELFAEIGEVTSLQLDIEERTQTSYALVEMASEKVATKAHRSLNGYQWGDYSLSVSYPDVDPRELTAKQRKAIEDILAALEETEVVPRRQLEAMARLCGLPFVEALVHEALEIDAGPGIMTSDGSRPRSKGGVFFYLARYRMSPAVRRIVYNRKGKIEES
jgi:RNA recognition motif-containing protein